MTARNRRPLVLVVDDEEPIRAVIRAVLVDEGFDVATAFDAEEALLSCHKTCPDIILLDLNLPGIGGAAFLSMFRAAVFPATPVVVVSAMVDGERTAHEMHADDFVRKPFTITELTDAVRRHTAAA
ncbi:MAG: response regulator [Chloroflexota bacterium]|nr:response regulator [Chloroflexota bacterium]